MLERFLLILENCITIIDFWIIKILCVKARFTISWGHAFKVRPSHSPMSLQERTHRVFRPLQVLRQRFKLRDYDEEEPGHSDETQSSPWGRHTKQKSLSLFFHNTRRTVCSYPPISAVREVFLSAQISRGGEGWGGVVPVWRPVVEQLLPGVTETQPPRVEHPISSQPATSPSMERLNEWRKQTKLNCHIQHRWCGRTWRAWGLFSEMLYLIKVVFKLSTIWCIWRVLSPLVRKNTCNGGRKAPKSVVLVKAENPGRFCRFIPKTHVVNCEKHQHGSICWRIMETTVFCSF